MKLKFPFNWYNKFGTIPSEFREAMSYEEQILWLCQAHEDLQAQFDEFKVSIDEVKEDVLILQGKVSNLETNIDNKQDKLVAGENIYLFNNDIQAHLNLPFDVATGSFIDLSGDVGSVVDLTPVQANNTGYFIKDIKANDYFLLRGTFTLAKLDEDNKIVFKYEEPIASSTFSWYESLSDGTLVVSWYGTDENTPYIAQSVSANYVIKNVEGIPAWVKDEENETSFVTEVNSESANNEVPSALAVYSAIMEAIGGGQVISYNDLTDKPSINGTTISGDVTINDVKYLRGETYNVYSLQTGVYLISGSQSTELYCGDKEVTLGSGWNLTFIFGDGDFLMIRNSPADSTDVPLITSGYCTAVDNGTIVNYSNDVLKLYGVDYDLSSGTSSDYYVPSAKAVVDYVGIQVGNIETLLNNINVGNGVV